MENTPQKSMWSAPDEDQVLLDEDCSPTKTCRNMVGISFDGWVEDDSGMDLQTTWRATLEAEGKLSMSGDSIKDLVLGSTDS